MVYIRAHIACGHQFGACIIGGEASNSRSAHSFLHLSTNVFKGAYFELEQALQSVLSRWHIVQLGLFLLKQIGKKIDTSWYHVEKNLTKLNRFIKFDPCKMKPYNLFFQIWCNICSVESSTDYFKGMVQGAHLYPNRTMKSNFPQLKQAYAKNSDPKCRINLLKRIKIIVNTRHLFSQVVGQTQFWGILGAEDAGKSTFIKVSIYQHTIISIYCTGPSIGA